MGRSLSKEWARVLKGMGFIKPECTQSGHHWFLSRNRVFEFIEGGCTQPYTTARIVPDNDRGWTAVVRLSTWPPGEDRRQTFPDPITAAIWIEFELSQEAGA